MPKQKPVAIYARVSSQKQDTASQLPDLKRWADAQDADVLWFEDEVSGTTMDRPQWSEVAKLISARRISAVVVWRLDRLGRNVSGLSSLFDEMRAKGVDLVSLKDGLTLSTPAGRLMANVLASVAQFETEIRAERVLAGQAKAKANGKTWGGSKPGVRKKVTQEQIDAIEMLYDEEMSTAAIARTVKLGRNTVASVIREIRENSPFRK